MARRKSSWLDDVMQLGAYLPWWISAPLAAGSYFALHHYSQVPMPTVADPGDISTPIIWSAVRMGAAIGQYVIPVLLAGGMIMGIGKKLSRKSLFRRVVTSSKLRAVDDLTWIQFEDLLHQYFSEKGFSVNPTGAGADGGVDLWVSKDGHRSIVQCKHWQSQKVGVQVIREQFGIMTAEQVDRCYIVTSGAFTQEAKDWASDKAIELINGKDLHHLLGWLARNSFQLDLDDNSTANSNTSCSRCGSNMVLRTAKRGKNPGSKFWGCSTYPKCRNTRQL